MADESIDILLKADDQATGVIKSAADKIDANVKRIKDVGGKAKASTEFIGVLAQLSGNSQIAGLASQLAGATEKMGQFSEVSKAGGAGALAFKLGLVGLVATIAVGVGNALGNVIFQTEKFNRKLADATTRMQELQAQSEKLRSRGFEAQKTDIDLIRDPEAKEAAQKKLLDSLNKNIQGVTAQAKQSKKAADEWADAWQVTGDRKGFADAAKREAEDDKKRLDLLKEQRDEVANLLSDRTKGNEKLKEENALKDKSENYVQSLRDELEMLKAIGSEKDKTKPNQQVTDLAATRSTTGGDTELAKGLLTEIELLKLKGEEEKAAAAEKLKADDKAKSDTERLADLKQNALDQLEKERILLEAGAKAADIFALKKQGLNDADAEQIANLREKLEADKKAESDLQKAKDEKDQTGKNLNQATNNTASESRLLSRGPQQDNGIKLLQSSEQILKELQQQRKENADAKRLDKKDKAIRMKVVS